MTKNKDEFKELEAHLEENDTDYNELVATKEEIAELVKPGIQETEYLTDGKEIVVFEEAEVPAEIGDPDLEEDFAESRKKIHSSLEVAEKSMKQLAELAAKSQHPRAYEVVALLAKTITDSSKALMELYQKQMEIENPKNKKEQNIGTQNNLIVGTTAQIDEIISKLSGDKDAKD